MGGEIIIPPLFKCPISLDLFKDPVTLCTGQTYDRFFIEKWLSEGNLTCPVTMQKLQDSSMVSNNTLRHLIDEWLHSNNQTEPSCPEFFDFDFSIIESDVSTVENKLRVLEKVQSLSQEGPIKNFFLIEYDLLGASLKLVLKNEESLELVEKGLVCVSNLMPFSDLSTLNILLLNEESNYGKFISLFEKGSVLIKKSLCFVIEQISSRVETQKLSEKIGKCRELLRGITRFVREESDGGESGIKAISALCSSESNLENLAREGAVEGLVWYISSSSEGKRKRRLVAVAMCAMESLVGVESGKRAMMNDPLGVCTIVKMVFRVSDHEGSESAVNCLLILCCEYKSVREISICCGVLTQLLLLLQSQCSERTKTNARMLLKLLADMC